MKAQINLLDEIIVDNFAGGGGASTGIELAAGRPVTIAINHDADAIRMHKMNHPYTEHFQASVWDIDPEEVCRGRKVGLAWFSPDCKHFSKAKGGKPKDKSIRGLAWIALRWAAKVRPRVIMLENVEEFKTWGPLNRGHRPIKAKQGKTFEKFISQLSDLGYEIEYRELVASDYGAPTSRKRFFIIARCDGEKIVWPEPTHGDPKSEAVKSGKLLPWRTAAEIIDWSIPCPSIFERKKPLAENTLKRIARGIQKFVIDNPEPFIVQVNHSGSECFRGQKIVETMPTITAKHGFGIVMPTIASIGQTGGGDRVGDIQQPVKTIVSKAEHCLVMPTMIQYHTEQSDKEHRGQAINDRLQTVDAANRYGLVTAHISQYFDGGYTGAGRKLEAPLPTVTAWDHNSIVTTNLCVLRNNQDGKDLREPLPTITTSPGHFAEVRALLIKYYGNGSEHRLDEPLDTITAKDRFGLVTVKGIDYQIVDIGLRMLTPRELYNAQGFPKDYIIDRDADGKSYTKSKQVARCGNAVPPPFAEALVRANLPEWCGMKLETMEQFENQVAM